MRRLSAPLLLRALVLQLLSWLRVAGFLLALPVLAVVGIIITLAHGLVQSFHALDSHIDRRLLGISRQSWSPSPKPRRAAA